MASYKDMLDSAFSEYYARFRALNALSEETSVTLEELFPEGQSIMDRDRMHKMLSMDIVKRDGLNGYWLDEKRAADGKGVLKQRLLLLIVAVIFGVVLGILKRKGLF